MSPFSVKWIYELQDDYSVNLLAYFSERLEHPCAFEDRSGRTRLVLYPDGRAIVKAGYAWDGCTPKFAVFDILLGTPDGIPNNQTRKPKTYYASLIHDVLYQFLDVKLPIKRSGADRAFLNIMARDAFAPRYIYWTAVRLFGGVFRIFTCWKRSYAGRRVGVQGLGNEPSLRAAA
jgi:hypothetical protein